MTAPNSILWKTGIIGTIGGPVVSLAVAAVLFSAQRGFAADESAGVLRDGWKWQTVIPKEQVEGETIRRESRVTLWTDEGWLVVRRATIDGELEWQVVLARASDPARPQVRLHESRRGVDINYRRYFIRDGGRGRLRIYRERKTKESPAWPALSLEEGERRPLGGGSCAGVAINSFALEQWCWVQSGPSEKRPDLWLRLQPTTIRKGAASRWNAINGFLGSIDGPAEMFYGDCQLQDEGDLFVGTRMTIDEAEQGLEEPELEDALRAKHPPALSAVEWLNTDDAPSLDKLRGQVVLLCFWADSSRASVNLLPQIEEVHRKLRDRGLSVIGIHPADRNEGARHSLKEHNVSFPVMVDTGETARRYGVSALPSCFLIDKSGKVVWGFGMALPREARTEELLNSTTDSDQ